MLLLASFAKIGKWFHFYDKSLREHAALVGPISVAILAPKRFISNCLGRNARKAWEMDVVKELRDAGSDVDLNKFNWDGDGSSEGFTAHKHPNC